MSGNATNNLPKETLKKSLLQLKEAGKKTPGTAGEAVRKSLTTALKFRKTQEGDLPADKSVAIDEDIKGMMGMIDAALDDQKDVENAMDTLVTTVFEKLNNNSTKFSVLFKELSFGKLAYDLDKAKIEIPQDIVGIEQPLIKKLIEINVSCSEVIDELKEGIVDKDKRADFGDHIRKNFIEPSISTIAKLVSFGPDHPLVAQIAKFAELFTKQVDQLVSVLNQYELIYTLHQSDNKHAQFYSYDSIHGELHSADHKNRSGTRDRFVDNYGPLNDWAKPELMEVLLQDYIGHVSALSIDLQSRLAQAKATKEDERPPFHKTRIDNLNALTRPFAELNMAFEALHSQKEDKRDTEKYAAVYKEWEHIIMQEVETVEMIADDLLSEVEALVTHSEDGLKDDDKNNVIPSIEASLAQSSLWAMGIINRLWNKLTASDKKIITEVKASLDEIKNILDKIKGSQG